MIDYDFHYWWADGIDSSLDSFFSENEHMLSILKFADGTYSIAYKYPYKNPIRSNKEENISFNQVLDFSKSKVQDRYTHFIDRLFEQRTLSLEETLILQRIKNVQLGV